MITNFKSALNKIKAEEELVKKTEKYLKETLIKNEKSKIDDYINWGGFYMKKKFIFAASLAVLFLGGSTGAYAYYQTPVSYLSLDINPSVELGINAFDKVVQVEAYNEDGEKILEEVDVICSDVTEAVGELVSSADNNGYIAEDGSTVVSVTTETDNEEVATELETVAEEGVNSALEETEKEVVVHKDNIALARRDEARKLEITPGKLNLIQKLQAVDPDATVEEYKDASVNEIMKTIKNIRKNGNAEGSTDEKIKDPVDSIGADKKENTNTEVEAGENLSTTGETKVNAETTEKYNKNKGNNNSNNRFNNKSNSNYKNNSNKNVGNDQEKSDKDKKNNDNINKNRNFNSENNRKNEKSQNNGQTQYKDNRNNNNKKNSNNGAGKVKDRKYNDSMNRKNASANKNLKYF